MGFVCFPNFLTELSLQASFRIRTYNTTSQLTPQLRPSVGIKGKRLIWFQGDGSTRAPDGEADVRAKDHFRVDWFGCSVSEGWAKAVCRQQQSQTAVFCMRRCARLCQRQTHQLDNDLKRTRRGHAKALWAASWLCLSPMGQKHCIHWLWGP